MAARIIARRLFALGRTTQETRVASRGHATAALQFQNEDNVDTKGKASQGTPSTSPRIRVPIGIFSDAFPHLGRGASLLNMMDTVEDLFSSTPVPANVAPQTFRSSNRTPWDVMEDAKAFKLRLDMPGLSKEDVKVDVEEGNLTIKGEHKAEEGQDDWSLRSVGSYNIRIKLPDNVKADAIKAELKNGVLQVTAPKAEETKKRLEVRVD